MSIKSGRKLRELLCFVAICGGIFGGCSCVLSVASARDSVLYRVNLHRGELLGWEACRETRPGLFRENEIAVARCVESLAEAEGSFWANLSVRKVMGLYVLAAVGGAAGGYLATYILCSGCAFGVRTVRGWFVLAPASQTPEPAEPAEPILDNPATSA